MYSPKLYIIVIAISMCIYYTKKYINVYLHFALRRMIHKIRVDENAFMAEAIQSRDDTNINFSTSAPKGAWKCNFPSLIL